MALQLLEAVSLGAVSLGAVSLELVLLAASLVARKDLLLRRSTRLL